MLDEARIAAPALAAIFCLALVPTAGGQDEAADRPPPNIVFLLVDDLGYGDVGAYGNTYHRTPHIDRLAAEGVRFTDAYAAAPNCSPTRGSILTGRWPARTGLTQYLPGNFLPHAKMQQLDLPLGLPLAETILPEPLARAGYATACIGKWHLGAGKYAPERRGFDESFASGHWGAHQRMFAPHRLIKVPGAEDGDYMTDSLTSAAVGFLERNRERPFFLYMSYYAVHGPIQAKQSLIDAYAGRRDPTGRAYAAYAAMVEGVDRSVGMLLATLERLGVADNTAVFFFSDNGGVPRRAFNGGFRSGKGYLWEGGIREPLIVRWPASGRRGEVESTPVSSVDLYPTILEIARATDLPGHAPDGASLLPLLRGTGGVEREALYWHYPHYSNSGSTPAGAIRSGPWKLMEFFEDGRAELYDLSADPSETADLAAAQPDRASALREKLQRWRESVGAGMPQPNPRYERDKATERQMLRYKAHWDPADPVHPLR